MNKYVNEMEDYLYNHNYISKNKNKDPLRQQELSQERASCIVQKYRTLTEEKDKEIERLNNIIELKTNFINDILKVILKSEDYKMQKEIYELGKVYDIELKERNDKE